MQPKDAALRKRTQITLANRTMFVWIAAASVLIGFALVVSIFLGQKLAFNEKILAEKQKTITTLSQNNAVVPALETAVRVLDTNSALATVKSQPDDQAVQVILDALPSEANTSALGASLQNKLLSGINGLQLQSLQVDPVDTSGDSSASSGVGDGAENAITFRFAAGGNQTAFKQALVNLELSIRTIKVISLDIASAGNSQILTVNGEAYYQPATTIDLQDEVVRP